MLTMTDTIRYIEANIGYKFRDIEIDDNEIMDAIINHTLPVFSSYFPCQYRKFLTPCDRVPDTMNQFFIDSTDPQEPYEILGVSQIYVGDYNNLGYDTSMILGYNYASGFSNIFANLGRMAINPVVFEFIPPNRVEIRPNSYKTNFLIELKVVHPPHLRTIHPGMEEYFKRLALYDIQIYLYNIRSRFQTLNTPFGQIDLNLDILNDAFSKREELLELFRRNMGKGFNRKRVWIY